MKAPQPLLQHLAAVPGMESGRRLVLLLSQLGYRMNVIPILRLCRWRASAAERSLR